MSANNRGATPDRPDDGRSSEYLAGGAETFEAVFAREYAGMVRLAYLMIGGQGSTHDAEGVVQHAFADVYRQGPQAYTGAYVRRSVINRSRDHTRRLARWRRRLSTLEPSGLVPAASGERVDVIDVLRRLSARQRAAVVLRYYGDLSIDDIAEALALPPNTVKSLIHRGLARLRREIGEPDQ